MTTTTDYHVVNEAGGLVRTAGDLAMARAVARREARRLGQRLQVLAVTTTVETVCVYRTRRPKATPVVPVDEDLEIPEIPARARAA